MPTAPLRPCAAPGCPVLGPCPKHAPSTYDQERRERQPWRLWYALARWRHPVWGLRSQVLRDQPLCADCTKQNIIEPSVEVDHIVPHRGDARLFWDRKNLQGLCKFHHGLKTGRGE